VDRITVRNPGIGALIMETKGRRILVDAFNAILEPVEVFPGDIILFTHDDGDHFSPESLPEIHGRDIAIVGPPSIVKPILMHKKADIGQIEVLYSNPFSEPAAVEMGNVGITCFNTRHFNHWEPIHNSYLLEADGKRIYITGDSLMTEEQAEITGETDVVVCNLVDEGYLKGEEKAKAAIQHNLSYLLKVRSRGRTRKVIGIHLLGFEGTVDAEEMKRLVEGYGFDDIIIPASPQQEIFI